MKVSHPSLGDFNLRQMYAVELREQRLEAIRVLGLNEHLYLLLFIAVWLGEVGDLPLPSLASEFKIPEDVLINAINVMKSSVSPAQV